MKYFSYCLVICLIICILKITFQMLHCICRHILSDMLGQNMLITICRNVVVNYENLIVFAVCYCILPDLGIYDKF